MTDAYGTSRDFLDPDSVNETDLNNAIEKSGNKLNVDNKSFEDAVNRFRLLLVKSAVDQIQNSWDVLTTVSDADIDRAAVKGIALKPQAETISLVQSLYILGSKCIGHVF